MATQRKKKNQTVAENSYSELEQYCIWLNEFYKSLRKAGFSVENTLWLLSTKESFPDWVKYGKVKVEDVVKFIEDEEE